MKGGIALILLRLTLIQFLFTLAVQASSQERERIHRFGLRGTYKIDDVDLWGAEASYQIYLKGIRRLAKGRS